MAGHDRFHCLHHSPQNRMLREPINWLFDSAEGDLLSLVNDDCLVSDGWARPLARAHGDIAELGVVACWHFQHADYIPDLAGEKIRGFPGGHRLMVNPWVQGSGVMFKRRCVRQIGPLTANERGFTPWCIRLAAAGWVNGWYVPLIHIDHMDDPRSPHTVLRTDDDLRASPPLSARHRNTMTIDAWVAHLRRSARIVQEAPADPRLYVGWRKTLRRSWSRLRRQLCCGCGACAYVSPDCFEMVDTLEAGRRPRRKAPPPGAPPRSAPPPAAGDDEALRVCPGLGLEHTFDRSMPGLIKELLAGWGPVLEVWEGHATDHSIRYAGSSGGAASALALACLEHAGMHGVLHIRARPDAPHLNQTVLSTSRWEILQATGSRYAPASPGEGLGMIEEAPGPCLFIGKPCDVAAVSKAQQSRPALAEKLGATIAFFCAGTPTTEATLELLRRLGVDDPSTVADLRYRGHGWPGSAAVTVRHDHGYETRRISYEESWGEILTNRKQWRCHVCADHSGELADISVGDPWYRQIPPGDPGQSLVLVRTERGRRLLREALEGGYLELEQADPSVLPASQPALLRGRGAVWGRTLACRLLGAPAPRYRGFATFRFWWSALTVAQKLRTFAGTVKRILRGDFAMPTHESDACGVLPVRATHADETTSVTAHV